MTREYKIKKKTKMFYARIVPTTGVYDVCELIIRTVKDDWFVGMDKRDKRSYCFNNDDINTIVFFDRDKALEKVKEAEKNKPKISNEIYYEED